MHKVILHPWYTEDGNIQKRWKSLKILSDMQECICLSYDVTSEGVIKAMH